jgi:hypothetical protein
MSKIFILSSNDFTTINSMPIQQVCILAEGSTFSWPHHLSGGYCSRPQQGSRGIGLEVSKIDNTNL